MSSGTANNDSHHYQRGESGAYNNDRALDDYKDHHLQGGRDSHHSSMGAGFGGHYYQQ